MRWWRSRGRCRGGPTGPRCSSSWSRGPGADPRTSGSAARGTGAHRTEAGSPVKIQLKQGHLCKSVILVDLFRFDMNECQHCVRQSLIWLIVTPAWQQRPLAVTGQRDTTTSLFIKRFSLNNRISVARNIQNPFKINPESFYAHLSHQKLQTPIFQ